MTKPDKRRRGARCPQCGKTADLSPDNRFRPFLLGALQADRPGRLGEPSRIACRSRKTRPIPTPTRPSRNGRRLSRLTAGRGGHAARRSATPCAPCAMAVSRSACASPPSAYTGSGDPLDELGETLPAERTRVRMRRRRADRSEHDEVDAELRRPARARPRRASTPRTACRRDARAPRARRAAVQCTPAQPECARGIGVAVQQHARAVRRCRAPAAGRRARAGAPARTISRAAGSA